MGDSWTVEDEKRFITEGFKLSADPVLFVMRYLHALEFRCLGFHLGAFPKKSEARLRWHCLSLLARLAEKRSRRGWER